MIASNSAGQDRNCKRTRLVATALCMLVAGAVLVMVAEDPFKSGRVVIEAAMPAAEAASPDSTPKSPPSPAWANSWNQVVYGLNDPDSRFGHDKDED